MANIEDMGVLIGGNWRNIFMNSLKMNHRLGQPSTATFDIREVLPGTLVTRGQEVIIYSGDSETINQTVPSPNPTGLRYESSHEGHAEGTIAFNALLSGGIEGVFANLYNLPDLRYLGATGDIYIVGGAIRSIRISDHSQYYSIVELGLKFQYSDGKYYYFARFPIITSPAPILVSTTAVELDVSRRVSVTWDTNGGETAVTLKLYINGSLETTSTPSGTMRQTYSASRYWAAWFTGQGAAYGIGQYFADARIWIDLRTPTEISNNAFTRLSGADLTDPNLYLYWQCDEGTGTSLTDAGTHGYNGTLVDDGSGYLNWSIAPDPWIANSGPSCNSVIVPEIYFGGLVSSVDYELQEPDVLIQHISVRNYSEICNRKLVNQNFMSSHDGKYYCNYIGLHLLMPEGIGYGCIPDGSATFNVPDWTSATAKKALDDIYTATGWIWYIDPYKEFRYHAIGYKTAPWDIADADSPSHYLVNSMKVSLDKNDYYNQILARIMLQVAGVQTTYQIRISNTAEIVARAAAEGGTGVYQHWEDITNAASLDQGISLAQGMLTNASTMGKVVSYTTRNPVGLKVGQTQNIENSSLGISGAFLIESIDVQMMYPDMIYKVTASSWKRYKNSALQNTLQSNFNATRNWTQALATITDVPYVPTY